MKKSQPKNTTLCFLCFIADETFMFHPVKHKQIAESIDIHR